MVVGELRDCEQCGAAFTPRREHARFCSATCRVAWNRAATTGPPPEASALEWALTAMTDTTDRLPRIGRLDRPRAFAVISEAVWWVTIVDATLVRYHPEAYDRELAAQPAAERVLIDETMGGLRFVRNQMGSGVDHVDFIRPAASGGQVRTWTWNPVAPPECDSLSARGRDWEMRRYRAYRDRLAGQPVGETFRRASRFLRLAAAAAPPLAEHAAG